MQEEKEMKQNVTRPIRYDTQGQLWWVDLPKSTWYPDGHLNKLVLKNGDGKRTFVRYNQVGDPICGNLSLA